MSNLDKGFVLNEWVPALRSGKYLQGTLYLRATDANGQDRYCCLGVAADLLVGKGETEPWEARDDQTYGFRDEENFLAVSYLTSELRGKIGLSKSEARSLVTMNDDYKDSFNRIAAYLEDLVSTEV